MQRFSERLISLRKELGLTQGEIAKRLNRSRSSYAGYETEGKEPDLESVCMFADFFGVSTDYLLGVTNSRSRNPRILFNDLIDFQYRLERLPPDVKSIVGDCFNEFYRILNPDVKIRRPERLLILRAMLDTLETMRSEISLKVSQAKNLSRDISALSEILKLQNELKAAVSSYLDRLLDADVSLTAESPAKKQDSLRASGM